MSFQDGYNKIVSLKIDFLLYFFLSKGIFGKCIYLKILLILFLLLIPQNKMGKKNHLIKKLLITFSNFSATQINLS